MANLSMKFWPRVLIGSSPEDCWLWSGPFGNFGYGRVPSPKTVYAHRLSWELHYGKIPSGLVVMHTCDVPACVKPSHLSLGTQADNLDDCRKKGRAVNPPVIYGVNHHNAKLDPAKAEFIRKAYADGASVRSLAVKFSVDHRAIRQVISGRTWRIESVAQDFGL